ncbi:unnamed protein product, partial [Gulo gulo]
SAKHFPRSRSLVPQVHSQDSTPASPGTPSYVPACRHRCSKIFRNPRIMLPTKTPTMNLVMGYANINYKARHFKRKKR